MSQVKVLVVDDSAFMRQVISSMLEADPDVCVVGVARDGEDALNKLARYEPNVLTLDLEMPKMDGLAFLAKLMTIRPMPVVVVSSWATAGRRTRPYPRSNSGRWISSRSRWRCRRKPCGISRKNCWSR